MFYHWIFESNLDLEGSDLMLCSAHNVIMVTISAKKHCNLLNVMERIRNVDFFNTWPLSVTLTLGEANQLLSSSYR
jgi:hypothetical protein